MCAVFHECLGLKRRRKLFWVVMCGKVRIKRDSEINTEVYNGLQPERRFSLNENRDVQREVREFVLFSRALSDYSTGRQVSRKEWEQRH